jgi:hypothetical protein
VSHNLQNNRWKKNISMNDVFRANGSDEFAATLNGEGGKINYRDFGHWADMADEAPCEEEFEESFLREQVEHLKKYVIKRTDIKGKGCRLHGRREDDHRQGNRAVRVPKTNRHELPGILCQCEGRQRRRKRVASESRDNVPLSFFLLGEIRWLSCLARCPAPPLRLSLPASKQAAPVKTHGIDA